VKVFIVLGLIDGVVYGLLATGLVLVYKGARVFNFAQAEFGTVAAFLAYWMFQRSHLPYWLSDLLAVVAVGVLGFVLERLIVRRLFNAPRVTLLVATAGIALGLIQLEILLAGANAVPFAPAIQGVGISVLGLIVTPQQLLTFVVLVGLGVAMGYFFSRTDLGLAVLATSQEPVATELVGIGTRRMSSFIWTMTAVLGGISGILIGAGGSIYPAFMTTSYLLGAFTAAVVGGIDSLPGAFVGGVIIGLTKDLGGYFLPSTLPGGPNLLVFAVLVLILLFRPQGLLGAEA
jgi:branched-chain amino acid transport system permease protein